MTLRINSLGIKYIHIHDHDWTLVRLAEAQHGRSLMHDVGGCLKANGAMRGLDRSRLNAHLAGSRPNIQWHWVTLVLFNERSRGIRKANGMLINSRGSPTPYSRPRHRIQYSFLPGATKGKHVCCPAV